MGSLSLLQGIFLTQESNGGLLPTELLGKLGGLGSFPGPCSHSVLFIFVGFLDSSVGKESTCNAGDTGSISELGRSAGEGIGYPLKCSWVSLVAQLVKNLPAMRETWVRSLGWEDPLENGKATQSPVFWPGEFVLYVMWHFLFTWRCNFMSVLPISFLN